MLYYVTLNRGLPLSLPFLLGSEVIVTMSLSKTKQDCLNLIAVMSVWNQMLVKCAGGGTKPL